MRSIAASVTTTYLQCHISGVNYDVITDFLFDANLQITNNGPIYQIWANAIHIGHTDPNKDIGRSTL